MKEQHLTLDYKLVRNFVSDDAYTQLEARLHDVYHQLYDGTGAGHEFTGWLDLPVQYPSVQLQLVKEYATRIQKQAQVLVVIGIGGSHLGGEAGLNSVCSPRYNLLHPQTPEIYFVGNNLSAAAWR